MTNADRADRADRAISEYQSDHGEFYLHDFLCDIAHWLQANPDSEYGAWIDRTGSGNAAGDPTVEQVGHAMRLALDAAINNYADEADDEGGDKR